jgi:hypothetical protein
VAIKTENDSAGPGLLVTSGEYDPCDNYLWWNFDFSRTGSSGSDSYLNMAIWGSGVAYQADATLYPTYGDYHEDSVWWIYVGPSSEHELTITLLGATGYWHSISADATYRASSGG